MRQIGTEFNDDPFKAPGTEGVLPIEIPAALLPEHNNWKNSTASAAQHRYCAKLCINFKAAVLSDAETSCMSNCFDKYHNAFGYFQKEKNLFQSNLAELTARGQNKYDARNI
jgi:hypothetical protein